MSSILGSIALCMALVSFVFGSAPFTPALVLVLVALPLAIVVALLGSWRLAVVTVYFSMASWFVVPIARELSFRIDYMLILMGIVGTVLGGVLVYGYKRIVHVT